VDQAHGSRGPVADFGLWWTMCGRGLKACQSVSSLALQWTEAHRERGNREKGCQGISPRASLAGSTMR
jgi:hypothetical protein